MTTSWHNVTPEEAKKHQLYGIKGWLALFAVGTIIGVSTEFGHLVALASNSGMTFSDFFALNIPLVGFIKTVLIVEATIATIILFLLFTKNKHFREWASSLLIGRFPLILLVSSLYTFSGLTEIIISNLIPWVVSCAVWVTYLQCSKRVRITFEHSIESADNSVEHQVATEQKNDNGKDFILDEKHETILTPDALNKGEPLVKASKPSGFNKTVEPILSSEKEEMFWENAANELKENAVKPGVWAKCFSEANGEESLARAIYMKYRVGQYIAQWKKEQLIESDLLECKNDNNQ